MTSLSSFLDMGGYGAFVWPSFAISAVLLIGVFYLSVRSLKANRLALESLSAESNASSPSSQQTEGSTSGETQA